MGESFPRTFNADYELLGVLGRGGMGSSVYKARQVKLDRVVALKVLDVEGEEETKKRFYSEAQSMKELNHQNLAAVYDYGIQDDKIFIAMTFVDGEPLSDIIRREKILPVKKAVYIAWQIAMGLEYAHEHGVIHRDIKPSNIMIKKNNQVCIIDFGISITNETNRLTGTGMTMGTPEYMSPEQCENRNLTLQSDIYNLGIVFYEMLSGDPPFTGGNPLAILNKHLHEKPPPLRKKNPGITPDIEKIVDKCLEKSMSSRYANFYDFIEDLKLINTESSSSSATTKSTLMEKLSKPERLMLLILCILPVLLILLILLLAFKKSPPEEVPPGISYLSPKTWTVHAIHSEIPLAPIFDNDLSTAWVVPKNSALKSNNGVLITIRFAKPTLVTNIGIAIGNQSTWDNFQKYSKPKDIWIRHANSKVKENKVNEQSSVRKISLEDKLGVQYPSWPPIEITEIMFELKTMQNDSKAEDFAISEIRLFGMEM
jgi:serine/threonine protein kinase